MNDESDSERRLRLIARRDRPERTAEPTAAGLDELARLIASQATIQQRLDEWIAAATAGEQRMVERIDGLERVGERVISQTQRSSAEVSARLHALIADERVRRAEHARIVEEGTHQAARLEEARAAIDAIAASQGRWMLIAFASIGATLILSIVVGLSLALR